MAETCESGFGLVNSRVYYARQSREIYQAVNPLRLCQM